MGAEDDRAGFEALAQAGAEDVDEAARALGSRLKAKTDPERLKALAALWLHVAIAQPEDLARTYDAAAEGWLGEPLGAPAIRAARGVPPVAIPPGCWTLLWALVTESGGLGSTSRGVAAIGELLPYEVTRRAERAAKTFPAGDAPDPSTPLDNRALARCPPGSLGTAFVELSSADGAQSLRRRDFWRLVAGYETTALHEMAFAAFQLAQTGHPAPARYLALLLTRVAFEQPAGGPIVLAAILTAWTHGRRSPPLAEVRWETLWGLTPDAARAKLGLAAYASPFPAGIFEQAAEA